MNKKDKEVKIGRNPKISEIIAWAEQNGLVVDFSLKSKPKNQKKEIEREENVIHK